MTAVRTPSREIILQQIGSAGPSPWYPSEYASLHAMDRDALDPILSELRLANLIVLTEWVSGRGQGYVLTELGREVLATPEYLAVLRSERPLNSTVGHPHPRPRPSGGVTTWERGEYVRDSLFYQSPPFVVRILFGLNLLFFGVAFVLAMSRGVSISDFLAGKDPLVLIETGAIHGVHLLEGEWWRLLTCCFVHIGLVHLAVNMFSLYIVGPMSEQFWGHWRFLLIYLLGGIGGSWGAMLMNPNVLLAGASGAIWAILCSLVAWVLLNRDHLPPAYLGAFLRRVGFILLLNVGISFMPGISASAHFAGGAVGFLVGSLLHFHRFGAPTQRFLALVILLVLPGMAVWSLQRAMDTDPQWAGLRPQQRLKQLQDLTEEILVPAMNTREAFRLVEKDLLVKLINQPPAQRDPDALGEAIARLQSVSEQTQAVQDRLQKVDPTNARIDVVLTAIRDYLTAQNQLIQQRIAQLKAGVDWDADRKNQLWQAEFNFRDATKRLNELSR